MPIAVPTPQLNSATPSTTMKANGHANHNSHEAVAFTEARLASGPHPLQLKYDSLPQLERETREFDQYIRIDLAHLVMLAEQDILSPTHARQLFPALLEIRARGVDAVAIDPAQGTLLLQVEGELVKRLGEDVAGRLHTARSRIDQGATARRMYKREKLIVVMQNNITLQGILISTAEKYVDTIMPTYTHMQQAQPSTFGHYLLSIASRLHDDFVRCASAMQRVNKNPLGGVGLAGTSWPINRDRTAGLLGFEGLINNSKLAREAYYAAEIASCLSFTMATLNDLATDLHIWSSTEFGMVELDDSFCSTSSIFPQKKNPVCLEVIKLAAGAAINWGGSALAAFRCEGTGDQAMRTVPLLDEAFETTKGMLELAGGIIETIIVKDRRMAEILQKSWCTTSNLADVLVREKGLSYRQAHHAVARLVRLCEVGQVARDQVTPDLLQQASMETLGRSLKMGKEELLATLDPVEFVKTRISRGAPGPIEVRRLVEESRDDVQEDEAWLSELKARLVSAEVELQKAIEEIMA
ncbi:argininosuccinate lyase [Kwoniella shandongensis]|uniref:Arginosuccinase n=1 Tax=Kwoniella shandongensis TaxID=1734106 RepID=A0A5M6BWP8_9TREE|nr:argininosuccinate lyase [Kwoniella shandongensis]KAA5527306.1 argininosuccinate lyase [Kwoniella shandongensis]